MWAYDELSCGLWMWGPPQHWYGCDVDMFPVASQDFKEKGAVGAVKDAVADAGDILIDGVSGRGTTRAVTLMSSVFFFANI